MSFQEQYKKFKNKIRRCNRRQLYIRIIIELRKMENGEWKKFEKQTYLPWCLLTILKQVFLFGGDNNENIDVDDSVLIELHNMAWDLEGEWTMALFSEDGHISMFSALSHRQFWHQRDATKAEFSRIYYLFYCLSGDAEKYFQNECGISIKIYIEMLLSIWTHTKRHNDNIFVNYDLILRRYGFKAYDVYIFLRNISRTSKKLRSALRCGQIKSNLLMFGEHAPFFQYPLLKDDKGYVVYSSSIIERALLLNVFEEIKNSDSPAVQKCFGDRFEEYVISVLKSSKANYMNEKEIGDRYKGKKTDALIIEEDFAIMIEAKSIRLSDYVRANPEPAVVCRALEDSIIKAIVQANELGNKLNENKDASKFALIVVIYDEVYLGAMVDSYEHYFKSFIDELIESGKAENGPINGTNLFIVSVSDFEMVCKYRFTFGDLGSLLTKAIEENSNPKTKKHHLTMHIDGDLSPIPMMNDNFEALWESIISRVNSQKD